MWQHDSAGFGVSDIYLNGNIAEQYMLCYYWMVATLTTNGQVGDMTPKSMLEVTRHRTPTFFPSMLCIITCCLLRATFS